MEKRKRDMTTSHLPITSALFLLAALLLGGSLLPAPCEARTEMPGLFRKKKKATAEAAKDSTADPYAEIVEGASAKHGLFSVYKKKESYYFEIPVALIGRDMLILNKLQRVPDRLGQVQANRGVNFQEQMVRFELDEEGKKLRVRRVEAEPIVPEGDAIARSVRDNYLSPLVQVLDVEARSKDSASVLVKVDNLYNGASTSFSDLFRNLGTGYTPNRELSRIIRIEAFPNNMMAYSELSATGSGMNAGEDLTVEVSSSLVLLPETPMRGRESDPRIGYFTIGRTYYSDTQQGTGQKYFLTRWRLEPKEGEEIDYLNGQLVEPRKPIVFYIDPATPAQWRPYICKGIEDWQQAFEKAGFKNAIRAVVLSDSTAAAADDASTATVTYTASTTSNAMGPSTCDPRSGEILDADIIWWHNVAHLLKQWLTVQTAAVNPAARQPLLPDTLMGEAIRFVACHETGHSLGLRHNMRASSAVPTDSLRSPTFTKKFNATASSIMDYARFNYVAQPGDGVDPANLMPHLGPYDLYAIEYGYRWFGPITQELEKKALEAIVRNHRGPLYEYSGEQPMQTAADPRGLSEDLGDDPVKSARLGIENLKRIAPHIHEWSYTGKEGQTYKEAADLFSSVISQWTNYAYHVLANVGGIYINNVLPSDGRQGFQFVPKARQEQAVGYLLEEVLTYPGWLFDAPVSRYAYLGYEGEVRGVERNPALAYQDIAAALLRNLLATERMGRMLENERLNGPEAFTAGALANKLHDKIFRATEQGTSPDAMERILQKVFVETLVEGSVGSLESSSPRWLNDSPDPGNQGQLPCHTAGAAADDRQGTPRTVRFTNSNSELASDIISLKLAELQRIRKLLKAKAATGDRMTRAHYQDLLLRIARALEPGQ